MHKPVSEIDDIVKLFAWHERSQEREIDYQKRDETNRKKEKKWLNQIISVITNVNGDKTLQSKGRDW